MEILHILPFKNQGPETQAPGICLLFIQEAYISGINAQRKCEIKVQKVEDDV